ncbi:aspartic proteinase 36-like [Impatiens glandulifera]|uniref:aspartic proteinase 36-like n=1 Tax=Impatiens glandulifera TaxID=253017 RepID=UPI001FB19E7B|nr:aspartic proteinase 36-like [Impatiens glandulifera]
MERESLLQFYSTAPLQFYSTAPNSPRLHRAKQQNQLSKLHFASRKRSKFSKIPVGSWARVKNGKYRVELVQIPPILRILSLEQRFCIGTPDCAANVTCLYTEVYGDGSYSLGYFVKDLVQYDGVSEDLQTMTTNQSFIFGCGASQSGYLDSSEHALDGIVGFGKSNSSFISQLAASGTVKKIFAHCLDGVNGGGIFSIGHVLQPKVNTTRLLLNKPHYNVNMTAVQVGSEFLNLTTNVSHAGDYKESIIDSGTTLAYFPDVIYQALVKKIPW